MAEHITYGEGGYNPNMPNNNIVERVTIDTPPDFLTDSERIQAIEQQNAELLDAISKATTLEEIREAAESVR